MPHTNGLDGTAIGGVYNQTNSFIANANDFTADTDYIRIPDSEFSLSGTKQTFSAWVKSDDLSDYEAFLGDYSGGSSGFIMTLWNSSNNRPHFWIAGRWHTSNADIPDDTWTHLLFTRNGSAVGGT